MNMYILIMGLIVLVALYLIVIYNGFISLINRAREAWSDIEVQMKRRYDLIPNLVETVKGYAAHESNVLEGVIRARNEAMGASGLKNHAVAEDMLSSSLKNLFALSESYPDLKANVNFLELQRELRDTEDKVQAARRFYNGNVRDLNIKVDSFPSNLIGKMFGFVKMDLFELAEDAAREPVKVSF